MQSEKDVKMSRATAEETEKNAVERKARTGCRKAAMALLIEIIMVTSFLIILFSFVIGIHIQRGNDMYPAIRDGDIVIYYRSRSLMNTEAVVYEAGGRVQTGRVEATEGTVISRTGDLQLTFDGIHLPVTAENGIYKRTYAAEETKLPVTVDKDCCFILGDNREEADDSRIYGQIRSEEIRGRIVTVIRRRQI